MVDAPPVVRGLLVWALFTAPEGVMMVLAGLGFLGIRRSYVSAVGMGVAVGTATVLARSVLPSGYHIPMILLVYCALLVSVGRISLKSAAIAFFMASLLVNLGQVLVAFPVLKAMGLSVQDTLDNVWLHIMFGWIGDAILIVGTMAVCVRKTALIQVPESTMPSTGAGATPHHG